jgi:hypothetical protein
MKNIPLQIFGTIETIEGKAIAMLSRDADYPQKAMVQWRSPSGHGVGLLMGIIQTAADTFELSTDTVFSPDSNGALIVSRDAAFNTYYQAVRALLVREGDTLVGKWCDAATGSGGISFNLAPARRRVQSIPLETWADFKVWATNEREKGKFVDFRGHGSANFLLQTTLHRAGRTRPERFCYETLPEFGNKAEAVLDTRFQKNDADDFGVLAGLAQHHGLPTPLLDLTASPYVAAFFAFADALENRDSRTESEHTHVRIFGLSNLLQKLAPPVVMLTSPQPYAAYLQVPFRKNARLVAQQGRFLVTNVADLESFLCQDVFGDDPVVTAVDVPIGCAAEALEDLTFMGLTAASMFPGLDGVCRSMRHEMLFRKNRKI